MGLFEMLRRREQAESVATPIGVGRRPPEVSATGDAARTRGAQGEPRLATVLGSSSPGSPLARLERRLAGTAVERDQFLVQQRRQLVDRFGAYRQQRLVGRQLMKVRKGFRTDLGLAKLGRAIAGRRFGRHAGRRW